MRGGGEGGGEGVVRQIALSDDGGGEGGTLCGNSMIPSRWLTDKTFSEISVGNC